MGVFSRDYSTDHEKLKSPLWMVSSSAHWTPWNSAIIDSVLTVLGNTSQTQKIVTTFSCVAVVSAACFFHRLAMTAT